MLLSCAEAANDNAAEIIQDLEDEVSSLQSRADAHPEIDYNNTEFQANVSLEEIADLAETVDEQIDKALDNVKKAQYLCLDHGGYKNQHPTATSVRHQNEDVHTDLDRIAQTFYQVNKAIE